MIASALEKRSFFNTPEYTFFIPFVVFGAILLVINFIFVYNQSGTSAQASMIMTAFLHYIPIAVIFLTITIGVGQLIRKDERVSKIFAILIPAVITVYIVYSITVYLTGIGTYMTIATQAHDNIFTPNMINVLHRIDTILLIAQVIFFCILAAMIMGILLDKRDKFVFSKKGNLCKSFFFFTTVIFFAVFGLHLIIQSVITINAFINVIRLYPSDYYLDPLVEIYLVVYAIYILLNILFLIFICKRIFKSMGMITLKNMIINRHLQQIDN